MSNVRSGVYYCEKRKVMIALEVPPRPNYDHLWKEVITELFEEFLLFFSPELYEQIDFTTAPEFLEQELHTIIPDSESNQRYADKLVKLQLKNGQEQWVFVHIEVQGGYEKDFTKRMFQYFYRVMDLYDHQIYTLVIFTSNISTHKMSSFYYEFYGTEIIYHYNTYRIASQSETKLLQSNNPFALAVLAGLYLIKSKKATDVKYKYKHKLLRLLLEDKINEKGYSRESIRHLLIFIDQLLRLPKQADKRLFQELKPLVEKGEAKMGLSLEDTSFAKFFREEGLEEGIEIGKKQRTIEIAISLLKSGLSKKEVAQHTGLTLEEIEKLKADKE